MQFEESMINAKMETTAEMGASEDGGCTLHMYMHWALIGFALLEEFTLCVTCTTGGAVWSVPH